MSVLSGKTIRSLNILTPFSERTKHEETNTSFGLSMCGYDISLDQDITLRAGRTVLASTLEHFSMPNDVVGVVHDKSTWARRGIAVQNTVIEPGWCGFLTLEITLSPLDSDPANSQYELKAGTPIAQVLFHRVDQETEGYGDSKYQNQARGPQAAR